MKNNYYNKRFLLEELDIEEQRDRIQQIITTCIETFEEIVESSYRLSSFRDDSEQINVGQLIPSYILNNNFLRRPSDFMKLRNIYNQDEIKLDCYLRLPNYKKNKIDNLYNYISKYFEKGGYDDYKLINKIVNKLQPLLNIYNASYFDDFFITLEYKNNPSRVTIKHKFKPLETTTQKESFYLDTGYEKAIAYIKSLYSIGRNALRQGNKEIRNIWNNIIGNSYYDDRQFYDSDFLTNDFVKYWNSKKQ